MLDGSAEIDLGVHSLPAGRAERNGAEFPTVPVRPEWHVSNWVSLERVDAERGQERTGECIQQPGPLSGR